MSFTRLDLALLLADKRNLYADDAKKTVQAVLEIMSDRLAEGDRLEFRGFGIMDVLVRQPKIGRNPKRPQDGSYRIPAKCVVRFRMGRKLDDRLNSTRGHGHGLNFNQWLKSD